MAGSAANLEYALVEMPADEGNQRRLDTGVVVHLVSSVVRVGDELKKKWVRRMAGIERSEQCDGFGFLTF